MVELVSRNDIIFGLVGLLGAFIILRSSRSSGNNDVPSGNITQEQLLANLGEQDSAISQLQTIRESILEREVGKLELQREQVQSELGAAQKFALGPVNTGPFSQRALQFIRGGGNPLDFGFSPAVSNNILIARQRIATQEVRSDVRTNLIPQLQEQIDLFNNKIKELMNA